MTRSNRLPLLWDFALAFYAQPQIAETCLSLQDERNANVCLLIGLRWLDESGCYLSDVELAALQIYIQPWTAQVVEPLRSLRRLLKQPVAGYPQDQTQQQVRTAIKQAELLAEKKLLQVIEAWSSQFIPAQNLKMKSNLESYLLPLGASPAQIDLLQQKF